jgi:hypothetical protein
MRTLRKPHCARAERGEALDLEEGRRTVISTEAGGSHGGLTPPLPTELENPLPMLNKKYLAADSYELHIKGHTMLKGIGMTKGVTGLFKPEEVRFHGNELYSAFLPDVAMKDWELGYYPNHYPLEALPLCHSMNKQRRTAAPRQPSLTSGRAVPGEVSATNRTQLLSALTSALWTAGRA